MIRNIITYSFLFCLLIAIPLALMGIKQVEIGPAFLAFIRVSSSDLNDLNFKIPDIPKIPKPIDVSGMLLILNVLIDFVNFFVSILNFVIYLLNIIIQLLVFIGVMFKNLVTFKDTLARYPVPIS